MGVGGIRSLVCILPYSEFCKMSLDRADVISLIEGDLTPAQNKLGWNEPHICCVASLISAILFCAGGRCGRHDKIRRLASGVRNVFQGGNKRWWQPPYDKPNPFFSPKRAPRHRARPTGLGNVIGWASVQIEIVASIPVDDSFCWRSLWRGARYSWWD